MNIARVNPKIAALLRGNIKLDPLPGKEKTFTRKNPSLRLNQTSAITRAREYPTTALVIRENHIT
jgi:hypothetical protein